MENVSQGLLAASPIKVGPQVQRPSALPVAGLRFAFFEGEAPSSSDTAKLLNSHFRFLGRESGGERECPFLCKSLYLSCNGASMSVLERSELLKSVALQCKRGTVEVGSGVPPGALASADATCSAVECSARKALDSHCCSWLRVA